MILNSLFKDFFFSFRFIARRYMYWPEKKMGGKREITSQWNAVFSILSGWGMPVHACCVFQAAGHGPRIVVSQPCEIWPPVYSTNHSAAESALESSFFF